MAVLDFTRATTGSFGLVGRIGATLVNAVVEWNDARSTRNALNDLSDRELEDIGLCRGDIDLVAEGRR
ncbi:MULTISPECIES: DUF1127 domain-containing protein [unclassified Ruegeria]|uniref:DUF1127 domain-containing protein n=1 Tax=unclassified Ruegeria TaxID=2625375 RepID=UPI00148793E0|nr:MULTISPECIES: DUF1127 domain-containing protein [unclassified Ruegeria]